MALRSGAICIEGGWALTGVQHTDAAIAIAVINPGATGSLPTQETKRLFKTNDYMLFVSDPIIRFDAMT